MNQQVHTRSVLVNPIEQAQEKLKTHLENGTATNLSIFEVAHLLDLIVYTKYSFNQTSSNFQICFN